MSAEKARILRDYRRQAQERVRELDDELVELFESGQAKPATKRDHWKFRAAGWKALREAEAAGASEQELGRLRTEAQRREADETRFNRQAS